MVGIEDWYKQPTQDSELGSTPTLGQEPDAMKPIPKSDFQKWATGEDEDQALDHSVRQSRDKDRDRMAEVYTLQGKTGLPAQLIERNLDMVKQQASQDDFDAKQFRRDFPKLAESLQDPETATIAGDDLDAMKALERTLTREAFEDKGVFDWFAEAPAKAFQQGQDLESRNSLAFRQYMGDDSPELDARIAELESNMGQDYGGGFLLGDMIAGSAEILPNIISSIREGAKTGITAGITGGTMAAAAGQIPPFTATPEEIFTVPGAAAAGFTAGSITGAAQYNFQQLAGESFREFRNFRDQDGERLDAGVARIAATITGAASTGLELFGLGAIVKSFPGGEKALQGVTKKSVKAALKNPTVRGAMAKMAARFTGVWTIETMTEVMQEGVLMLGGELAKNIDPDQFEDLTAEEVEQRLTETFIAAGTGMALISTAGPGARMIGDYAKVKQSQKNQQIMEALGESTAASKTRERMPSKFREMIAKIREGGPIENVQVPVEKWDELFQGAGIDPQEMSNQVTGSYKAYTEAKATGGDLVIPIEAYAEQLAATEYHQSLSDNIRFRPGEMTPAEGRDWQANEGAELRNMLEEFQNRPDDTTRAIYDDAFGQLQGAGRDNPTAEREATLTQAIFRSLGERMGIDPVELYQSYNVSIGRPVPDVLKNPGGDFNADVDPILDRLRAGDMPSQTDAFGQSLLEFVRERGVSDPGGDLASRDIDRNLRAFERRAIRDDGLGLDDMASLAVQYGYMPGADPENVTQNELLEAIELELQGEPQFPLEGGNERLRESRQAMLDLQEYLDRFNIDLNEMDNAQVRAMLQGQQPVQRETDVDATTLEQADPMVLRDEGDTEGLATGQPVTFNFIHNTQSAQGQFGDPEPGDRFARDVEPAGRYLNIVGSSGLQAAADRPNMETGTLTFRNPIVVDNNSFQWKRDLSEQYGGLTGRELSEAILQDGYDGIITLEPSRRGPYISESVDLTVIGEPNIQQPEQSGVNKSFDWEDGSVTSDLHSDIDIAWPTDDLESGFPPSLTAYLSDDGTGAHVMMEMNADGTAASVTESVVENQGQGIGRRIYESLIEFLGDRGIAFESDSQISPAGQAMYRSLERDGYQVQRVQDGEIQENGWIEADGPIYRVSPPVDQTATQADTDGIQVEESFDVEEFRRLYERAQRANQSGQGQTGQVPDRTVAGGQAAGGWREATSLRGNDGEPAKLYRGASRQLTAEDFSPDSLGRATGNPSAPLGVWFTSDTQDAARYGSPSEYFADVRNPKVYPTDEVPQFDSPEQAIALREQLQADGFDGIVFDYTEQEGPIHVVAFEPGQVIEPETTLNQDNPNLYVAHNLTVRGLMAANELGGLAAPSLAVGNIDQSAFESFGEITLLADPSLLDTPKVRTFDADVYSPRQPRPEFDVDHKKFSDLRDDLSEAADEIGAVGVVDVDSLDREGPEALLRDSAMQYYWLKQEGKAPAKKKQKIDPATRKLAKMLESGAGRWDLINDPKAQKIVASFYQDQLDKIDDEAMKGRRGNIFFNEDGSVKASIIQDMVGRAEAYNRTDGVDRFAMRQAINKKMNQAKNAQAFEKFVTDTFNELNQGKRLFKGFTNSGNRKYIPYTMENVVKEMTRQLQNGEGFNYGPGSIRSTVAKEFKTRAQIQADRDRIIAPEQMEAIKEESMERVMDTLEALKPYYRFDADGFNYRQDASEAIAEGPAGLREAFDLDDDGRQIVRELTDYLRNLPTEYFEAKAGRTVQFSEFQSALVPKGAPKEAVQILRDAGLKIRRYDPAKEGARAELIRNETSVLFQDRSTKGPRGRITFPQSRKFFNIELLERADLSTFIHESGHLYLEILRDLSSREDAPAQIRDDFQKILNWMGVESGDQIATEQHELWARGFEAYIMEGKAPSAELRPIFARFKAWLNAIYSSLKSLNVELTDEVRGVMDRLVATDQEIAEAEQEAGYAPLFEDAAAAGMTDAEYQSYRELAQKARQAGEDQVTREVMREYNREQQKWWLERRSQVRDQVAEEVNQRPEYVAAAVMGRGKLPNGDPLPEGMTPFKMSKQALIDMGFGQSLSRLPRPYVYTRKGGITPDQAAEVFGYRSGEEMLTALINARPRRKLIEAETETRMKEEFGAMMEDGGIAQAAEKAVHNDRRADVMQSELRQLGTRSNRRTPPAQILKDAAARIIGEKKVRDVQPHLYSRAELKASREAFDAVAKGDFEAATQAKQKQLLNHYMYREAMQAREDVDKTVDLMAKFSKKPARIRLGKAGADYLEQIDALLARYEFRRGVSLRQIDRRKSLQQWVDEQNEQGFTVAVPDEVLADAKVVNYKDVPVDTLRGIRDTVRQIEHMARLKNKLLTDAEGRSFDEQVDIIVDTIEANHTRKPEAPRFTEEMKDRIKDFAGDAHGWHLKPEFIFRWLDGDAEIGPVWKALFQPLADAELQEQTMNEAASQAMTDIMSSYTRAERAKWHTTKHFILSTRQTMNKAAILSAALNWGNQYNRDVMMESHGWDQAQMAEILGKLDRRDWDLVQAIWDHIDSYWPQIEQMEKDLNGVAPEKVQPVQIVNEHGTFRGGYYPIKYDPRVSTKTERREEKAGASLFENSFSKPATKTGHTKERQGSGGQVLRLDLNVLSEHIANVIHDLSHRRAIVDVNRLTEDKRVQSAIKETAGRNVYAQIRPWLQAVANEVLQPQSFWERIIGRVRVGATVVNMGLKVTTAIVQPLGYLNSIDLIGARYAWRGLTDFFGNRGNGDFYAPWANMKRSVAFVQERSVMMQNRQKTFDRDVRDSLKRLTKEGPIADAQRSFFILTGLMDMSVSVPTWMGAYKKAMEGNLEEVTPGDEAAAIQYADSIVRQSQSAGGVKDLARIQRGGEIQRSFVMFYSYFNVLYNQLSRKGSRAISGQAGVAELAASAFLLWFAPAILGELVAMRGPEDDEEWAKWAATQGILYPAGTIVGLRDVANAALTPFGYGASPAFDAFGYTSRALTIPYKAISSEEEVTRADVKSAVLAAGYWGKLPSRQAWITGEYIFDLATGEDEPESPQDFVRDLFFSRPVTER